MALRSPLADFQPLVRTALRWLLAFRFLSNVGHRFAYSFLPALSRGTGLSVDTIGTVLALRDLTGVGAPLIGRVAQRRGTAAVMTVGAGSAAVAYLVAGIGAIGLIVGLIASGIAKIAYDVAMNAWVGDQVAYSRRAQASGLVEMTWAAAALIGVPACGLLIDSVGWWMAPIALGTASMIPAVAIARISATTRPPEGPSAPPIRWNRQSIGALTGFGSMALAAQFIIVGHGLWLEDDYGLSTTSIGFAVILIGLTETISSATTAAYTDRWGKRRSIMGGLVIMAAVAAVFALVGHPPLIAALAMLALIFLGFEFAFVSTMPLLAELEPLARAKFMGIGVGAVTVVRAAGSPLGLFLYGQWGWTGITAGVALVATVSWLILWLLVTEPSAD